MVMDAGAPAGASAFAAAPAGASTAALTATASSAADSTAGIGAAGAGIMAITGVGRETPPLRRCRLASPLPPCGLGGGGAFFGNLRCHQATRCAKSSAMRSMRRLRCSPCSCWRCACARATASRSAAGGAMA
ncbi:hypothetical protein [Xanthomonas cerealis]|uniref:hypothetical protein n=1 Tax=Xanthomonas cerealis TaxID=3390025 RepID=UPI001F3EA38B|nr:hypothetical protein [Xanthomonas translucens]